MQNRLFKHTRVCWLIAAGGASLLGIASGQDASHPATKVAAFAAGSDYLQTTNGTEASIPIGGKTRKVTLTGVPIKGLGNADTIIERTEDAVFPTGGPESDTVTEVQIPITLTALNLAGTVPGPNGGSCTVTIMVASGPASTGMLTLYSNGMYSSSVTVYFTATFTPIPPNTTCYPPITTAPPCTFNQKGGHWSTHPLSGEYEVVGPYGDLNANVHTNLPPGYADFYLSESQNDTARTAAHATCEALAAVGTPCPPKVSPTSLNFGTVAVGTSSASQTVIVTNDTGSALTFTGFAIVGADHVDFAQTNTCGANLANGGSCTISVTFTPTAAGTRTAQLQISDNGGGSPQIVSLTGKGL
jgi:ASPM-SPD-2-Hydin domain-containing protein